MKRPTRDDCLRLLAAQADDIAESPFRWKIFGVPYTEDDALQLAELCLLTGADLSPLSSGPILLALARRLADLEEVVRPQTVLPGAGVAQPSDGGSWL